VIDLAYNCEHLFSNFLSLESYLIFSLFLLFLVSFLYFRKFIRSTLSDIGFFLVFLGGTYNIYSRFTTGCVKDFLNFFNVFHFNPADVAVIIGVVILLFTIWKRK